jgi:hypothetical protein
VTCFCRAQASPIRVLAIVKVQMVHNSKASASRLRCDNNAFQVLFEDSRWLILARIWAVGDFSIFMQGRKEIKKAEEMKDSRC